MEYTVEELAPLKRKVAVRTPFGEVDAALNSVVADYRAKASIPGFRRGKAPAAMVERQFSREIQPEALRFLVEKQIRDILEELKLEPLSGPFHDARSLTRGQDLTYTVTFEFMPEFTLPEYQDFPVEQEEAFLAPGEVDEALEDLRKRMTRPELVQEKRCPVDGDIAVIDCVFLDDTGEKLPGVKLDHAIWFVGREDQQEEMDALVKTLQIEETGEKRMTLPENFSIRKIAGQTLRVQMTLCEIYAVALPELNDAMARQAGNFEDLAALREAASAGILHRRAILFQSQAQQKLLDALLKQVEYPLPEDLVERQAARMAMEELRRVNQKGTPPDNAHEAFNRAKAEARSQAEHAVRGYIFLQRAARAEQTKVEEQDFLQEFRRIAEESNRTAEEVQKEFFQRNDALNALHDRLVTEKTLQAIYAKAKVSMIPHTDSNPVAEAVAEPGTPAPDGESL